MSDHTTHSEENRLPQQTLLEQILDRDNLKQAWARVRANKGAAGIDGMSVADFPAFSQVHMLRIMDQIREGRYAPARVKRVWIPKPDGSKRPLGIPTVLDRVIQQAIAQVLSPLFDADFSESSYGLTQSQAPSGFAQHFVLPISASLRQIWTPSPCRCRADQRGVTSRLQMGYRWAKGSSNSNATAWAGSTTSKSACRIKKSGHGTVDTQAHKAMLLERLKSAAQAAAHVDQTGRLCG